MRDATYDPNDHYWHVLDRAQVWSSARCAYIAGDDQTYAAWRKGGGLTTRIASEGELWDVLAEQAPDKLPDEPAAQERRRERILGNVDAATLKCSSPRRTGCAHWRGKPPLQAPSSAPR